MFSILIPSNRPFDAALRSLDSALQYVEKRSGFLIVSDNSGDARKQKALLGCSPNLIYSVPDDMSAQGNLLNAINMATTDFVMLMGDDDEIYESPDEPPLDLSTLPADYVGVKPLIAVTNAEGQIKRVKDFALEQNTASERMFGYNENSGGDNSAFYSIFRRLPFSNLLKHFYAEHPTKPGNADWALAYTLFSYGKLAYDPSTILKYNFQKWESGQQVDAQVKAIFTAANLDASAAHYRQLLIYLDMMILSHSHVSPLGDEDKADIAENAGRSFLQGFLNRVVQTPEVYDPKVVAAVRMWMDRDARNPQDDLQRAIDLTGFIDPSLPGRYRTFLEVSRAA
ncbi:hypothetical protein [Rhizobium sp. C1]|uniref:hypothetical protein n=1 Tax=Rhizobium sp. C1 TaxID=1349799 RepID=UPI001E300A2E|nr:hypothetical protein [Rhizobium sp. C1]MCD2176829.1 hypothetical protein [Rhizobium sp. C1]